MSYLFHIYLTLNTCTDKVRVGNAKHPVALQRIQAFSYHWPSGPKIITRQMYMGSNRLSR